MTRSHLPIGIRTFRKISEGDCYYVDQTGLALRLIENGTHYFLSRPRRVGMSLLLDSIADCSPAIRPHSAVGMLMSVGTVAGTSR